MYTFFAKYKKIYLSKYFRPFNTEGALQRAKRAVEQHYAVVGVLEDLNSTFTVLENYIPRFFEGASQVFRGWY